MLGIDDLEERMAKSRDPKQIAAMWTGWHKVGAPMRDRYARFVELSNQGARELGFADTGALWRSGYDMTPEQFSAELERLWTQVEPLYQRTARLRAPEADRRNTALRRSAKMA